MLCGCDTFLSVSIKMAERKKQKCSRKKVTIKGRHLSVEQKILLCGVTLKRTDINKFSCV